MERKMYWNPDGSNYSEVSNTFEYPEGSGRWFNYPSVFGGVKHSYDDTINHFRRNFGIDPETGINYGANVYSDPRVAGQDAADRSPTLGRGYARPVGLELGMLADRADIERTVHSDGSLLRDREGEQRDRDQFMMDTLGTATPFGAITKVDKLARAIAKLPMDEVSRMKRADDMGYTIDAYHGTDGDIKRFDPSKADASMRLGKGFYFSQNPSIPNLAAKIRHRRSGGQGANVMPVKLSLKNPIVFESYDALPVSGVLDADLLKSMGHDGVIVKKNGSIRDGEITVFEPHQIRSKFAKFDPTKSKSGDILAGVGGTALATPILSERE